jgi:nitrogen fixation/metabolism regulation signal transduction histidine kinase
MRRDLSAYRDRLTASERHAAWSLMARQIAHEVRNPLTPIAVSVADLKRSYEQGREDFPALLDQAVRTIGEEVRALKALLHEFAEFGRFPEPRPATFRVAELLAEIGTLYAGEAASGRLAVEPAPAGLELRADRDQLRQALVNLVQNGLDAVGPGGHVTVAASARDDAVELRVADDGPGLTREQRARLFVPHFTTKPHGSGLGLAIVERIVSDHGGSVAVESAPGAGTTFRLRLPRDAATARRDPTRTDGREADIAER